MARSLTDYELDANIETYRKFTARLNEPTDPKILNILLNEKRRRANPSMADKLGITRRVKIRPMFAWYDLWIGIYIDRKNSRAYVLPLPCVGFRIEW